MPKKQPEPQPAVGPVPDPAVLLADPLPHESEYPDYAAWLRGPWAQAVADWHQTHPFLGREPGRITLHPKPEAAARTGWDRNPIFYSAPPCGQYPGGNEESLPINLTRLKARLKSEAQRHLDTAHYLTGPRYNGPLPGQEYTTEDHRRMNQMRQAAHFRLDALAQIPDPATLAAEIRALYPPDLLAAAEAIMSSGLQLAHLNTIAKHQKTLTAAWGIHPLTVAVWLRSLPVYNYGLSASWKDLDPDWDPTQANAAARLVDRHVPEHELEFLDQGNNKAWRLYWGGSSRNGYEENRKAWDWAIGLDPAHFKARLPEAKQFKLLLQAFPEGPPCPELQKVVLQAQATALTQAPQGQPDAGGLAGWLRELDRRLKADPKSAAPGLELLRLTAQTLDSKLQVEPRLRRLLNEANRRRDPEVLEAALQQELTQAGIFQPRNKPANNSRRTKTSAPGAEQVQQSQSASTAPSRRRKSLRAAIELEKDEDARLSRRLDSPTLRRLIIKELQPRPHPQEATYRGQLVAELGRESRSHNIPLIQIFQKTGTASRPGEFTFSGCGLNHQSRISLNWTDPAALDPERLTHIHDLYTVQDLFQAAATAALVKDQRQARQTRTRQPATSLELTADRAYKAVRNWWQQQGVEQRLIAARPAALALGRMFRLVADPELLDCLNALLPRQQHYQLHLAHYNRALANPAAFKQLVRQAPAAALWWLAFPGIAKVKTDPDPEQNLANCRQALEREFHRMGGRDWTSFESLSVPTAFPRDNAARSLADQNTSELYKLRRHLARAANLTAELDDPESLTADDYLAQISFRLPNKFAATRPEEQPNREQNLVHTARLLAAELDAAKQNPNRYDPADYRQQLKAALDFVDTLTLLQTLNTRDWTELMTLVRRSQDIWERTLIRRDLDKAADNQDGCLYQWESAVDRWSDPETGAQAWALTSQTQVIAQCIRMKLSMAADPDPHPYNEGRQRSFHLSIPEPAGEYNVLLHWNEADNFWIPVSLRRADKQFPSRQAEQAAQALAAAYSAAAPDGGHPEGNPVPYDPEAPLPPPNPPKPPAA